MIPISAGRPNWIGRVFRARSVSRRPIRS